MKGKCLWTCIAIATALLALLFYYKGVSVATVFIALLLALCPAVLLWVAYKSERPWNGGDQHAKH